MSELEFKWPSKRIPQGGLFHPPKAKYSKETSDLIKLLMEEAKMSMMVRKKINYHLRNGEPLPLLEEKPIHQPEHVDAAYFDVMKKMRMIRRKSLDAIIASGAYDQPRYRPKPDSKEPIEKAKIRLQERMSGMKMPTSVLEPKRKQVKLPEISLDPEDRIDELLQEINERVDWLQDMEELGEGKKYRDLIRSQISQRLVEIKAIERKISHAQDKS